MDVTMIEADLRRQFPGLAQAYDGARLQCQSGTAQFPRVWQPVMSRGSFVHFLCFLMDDRDHVDMLLAKLVRSGFISRKQALELARRADGWKVPPMGERERFCREAAGFVSALRPDTVVSELALLAA